jgi:hypothetical protein
MPLATTPQHEYACVAFDDYALGESRGRFQWQALPDGRLQKVEFEVLRYGRTTYPLLRPTTGRLTYNQKRPAAFSFRLDSIPQLAGEGSAAKQAMDSLLENFHTTFQELVVKRPFEMNENETALWDDIRSTVDVDLYLNTIPITLRQFGTVVGQRSGQRKIAWEEGRQETIDLRRFPSEFAGYRVGQPFEAYVERDHDRMRTMRVFYVRRKSSLPTRTPKDIEAFANSLKSSEEFPKGSLD